MWKYAKENIQTCVQLTYVWKYVLLCTRMDLSIYVWVCRDVFIWTSGLEVQTGVRPCANTCIFQKETYAHWDIHVGKVMVEVPIEGVQDEAEGDFCPNAVGGTIAPDCNSACDSVSTQKWNGCFERLTEKIYPNLTSKACWLVLWP